ncbi:MAG: hypothetical protein V4474_02185 [Patescibacteria group bacterium]
MVLLVGVSKPLRRPPDLDEVALVADDMELSPVFQLAPLDSADPLAFFARSQSLGWRGGGSDHRDTHCRSKNQTFHGRSLLSGFGAPM